ncbi:hypothetical protein Dimus_022311 [Dionaea muscipula]
MTYGGLVLEPTGEEMMRRKAASKEVNEEKIGRRILSGNKLKRILRFGEREEKEAEGLWAESVEEFFDALKMEERPPRGCSDPATRPSSPSRHQIPGALPEDEIQLPDLTETIEPI